MIFYQKFHQRGHIQNKSQIYKGFIKLIGLQRKLLVARKELDEAKRFCTRPIVALNKKIGQQQSQLTREKQKSLPKTSKLPVPPPQLPKITNTPEIAKEEAKIKLEPQIKIAEAKESDLEIIHDGESSSSASLTLSDYTMTTTTTTTPAELPSTEIPSTEITSTKREDKRTH